MSLSPRSSGGYNNPSYCTKFESEHRVRNMFPMTSYHYAPVSGKGGDNYCYVDDGELEEEYELHISSGRYCTIEDDEIREPPIGASTTFRMVETNSRQRSSAEVMTSQGRIRNPSEIVSPPRTPKKNVVVITSTPRKNTPQKRTQPEDYYPTSPRMPVRQQRRQVTDDAMLNTSAPQIPSSSPMKTTSFNNSRASSSSRMPLSPTSQARKAIVYAPTTTSVTSTAAKEMQRAHQERLYLAMSSDNRSTAIITPMASGKSSSFSVVPAPSKQASPNQKSSSWIQAPEPSQPPPTGTLVVAGLFLLLCGAITSVLCFYMMWREGRRYYLDFGVLFGFLSVALGCLGFRSRNWQWLPNRNYVSGYIVLSMFSVLCAAGLIVLLVLHPRAGEPLADVAGGAVCGVAVLSLLLAATGAGASQCCKYPPPDNRVQHCAEGFTL